MNGMAMLKMNTTIESEAKPRFDAAELNLCAIQFQGILKGPFHGAAVARVHHVDEIDDDKSRQVAQAKLAGDFLHGFEVCLGRRFLDIAFAGHAA